MVKLHCMDKNWSGLRVSYGSNGYLFRSSDVATTSDYMLERIAARPPDHILTEWMSKERDAAYGIVNPIMIMIVLPYLGRMEHRLISIVDACV
jgi:hypothetical protein